MHIWLYEIRKGSIAAVVSDDIRILYGRSVSLGRNFWKKFWWRVNTGELYDLQIEI